MCGIAGFTRFHINSGSLGTDTLIRMGDSINHRGPDAHGEYLDDQVGLCHRRLSIIDLSDAGNQPMFSNCGNYIVVFNGEIYNYQSLRKEAESKGYVFNSQSDTEVILALYQQQGEDFVNKLNGMFAIAIWDKVKRILVLVRDRLGKKPLYYYQNGGDLIFASELKAILSVPGVECKIRPDAVYDYFVYQYIPDPKTIFSNMYKLPPGHMLIVDADGQRLKQYWNVSFQSGEISEGDAAGKLYELLEDSVRSRMISDVPLGAFLSGGIDSSAVVALMAKNSEKPITTCSIGFDSKKYDEVEFAKIIANQYATDHHEFTVKKTVAESLHHIASYFDEPFADPSFVPTYFVSGLARQKVTVALAGDGGDENFSGYKKYQKDLVENKLRNSVPAKLRKSVFPWLMSPFDKAVSGPVKKAASLVRTLATEADYGFYITNSFFREYLWEKMATNSFKKDLAGYHPFNITRDHYHAADTDDHLSKILYTDIKTYLPGDILVKVDRMSMAHSLETRAPLLDYRVVEFAASLPSSLKYKKGEKKYILKKAFEKSLPYDILYRKKMGFSVPLAQWLREEIKIITEETLFRNNSGLSNYFDMSVIEVIWREHLTGVADYSNELWSLLVFELWWIHYMDDNGRLANLAKGSQAAVDYGELNG